MFITKALAAPITGPGIGLKIVDFNTLTVNAVAGFIGIIGVAFFIYLLIGAVKYVTSGGDKTAVQSAQHTITYALVGLTIAAASYAIAMLLQTVLGISILTITI
jgi:hypothetical protein